MYCYYTTTVSFILLSLFLSGLHSSKCEFENCYISSHLMCPPSKVLRLDNNSRSQFMGIGDSAKDIASDRKEKRRAPSPAVAIDEESVDHIPNNSKKPEFVNQKENCESMDCNCTSEGGRSSPLKLSMVDEKIGKLEVNYTIVNDLSYGSGTRIAVVLKVNNDPNESRCDSIKDFKGIMRKTLKLIHCNSTSTSNSTCDDKKDNIAVNFQGLTTGCYQVKVVREGMKKNEEAVISCPQYFKSAVIPKDLENANLSVSCNFFDNNKYYISIKSPLMDGSSDPEQFKMILVDENNDTAILFPNSSSSEVLDNGMISYEVGTLKPGNYCHGIRYMDDRCLWSRKCDPKENCFWKHRIRIFESLTIPTILHEPVFEPKPEPGIGFWIVLILGSISIGLLMALAYSMSLIIKLRTSRSVNVSSVIENGDESSIRNHANNLKTEKLFLLYPRDCKLFMEAMAIFRQVLTQNRCEVSDIWDPKLTDTIIRSGPIKFIHNNIDDGNTTTIVVASKCSELIVESYFESTDIDYEEPGEFDKLFLYGIELLIEKLQKKCFAVRLRKDCSIYEERMCYDEKLSRIKIIEEYKEYRLPLHLKKLITDIHSISAVVLYTELNAPEDIKRFERLICEYCNYEERNPDYLYKDCILVKPKKNGDKETQNFTNFDIGSSTNAK